jgi:hypothetical protein
MILSPAQEIVRGVWNGSLTRQRKKTTGRASLALHGQQPLRQRIVLSRRSRSLFHIVKVFLNAFLPTKLLVQDPAGRIADDRIVTHLLSHFWVHGLAGAS